MFLPDVNVWLAMAFASHVHHVSAKTWFGGLSNDAVCFFCRMTQQGFLRLATNAKIFGNEAVTLPEAWQKYDLFMGDPHLEFADEPINVEIQWRSLTQAQTRSPHVWNDAYLAAFALTANLEIATFDQAFTQYANVKCTILT